jgi:hypothetical protein
MVIIKKFRKDNKEKKKIFHTILFRLIKVMMRIIQRKNLYQK